MMRGDSGMTLMELLIVISILGLLVTVMLPFQGRMSDNTKREETIQLLDSIRFGLLGAENAYDANGNRVLGGYVGDFGTLPDFVIHEWDNTSNEWKIPQESTSGKPQVFNINAIVPYNYDINLMPLGLWTNNIRVVGVSTAVQLEEHSDWNGPYVVPPRDDFTTDDDIYTYTDVTIDITDPTTTQLDENSKNFLLRQGEGRLTDGWGSSLLIYFDADENLHFVSAGSDRRIDFGNTSDADDLGPIDKRHSLNEDNLILTITKAQWDLEDQKIAMTRQTLQDLKIAIIGQRGHVTDGVSQPNGFIADMGSAELLTGSYVHRTADSTIYRLTDSSAAATAPPAAGWEAVSDSTTGNTAADYPSVSEYMAARQYYAPRPSLIISNADYVKENVSGVDKYYYCVQDSYGNDPSASPDFWVEDNSVAGHTWVPTYNNTTTYKKNSMTTWNYFNNVGFGAGWRGPYTSSSTTSLNDAWGNPIDFKQIAGGVIVISSAGPDGTFNNSDDIIENILRSDYEVPVEVHVEPGALTLATTDYVTIYTVFNGGIGYYNVTHNSFAAGGDGKFLFNNDRATVNHMTLSSGVNIQDAFAAAGYGASGGVWLPIGKVTAAFRQATGYTSPVGYQETFTIHPKNTPTLTLGD